MHYILTLVCYHHIHLVASTYAMLGMNVNSPMTSVNTFSSGGQESKFVDLVLDENL